MPIQCKPPSKHSRQRRHYMPSGPLLRAWASVNLEAYNERAIQQMKNGILWDRPAEILHHDQSVKTEDSRAAFFKYPIFNWFPSEMIPGNWMPQCGACFECDRMVHNGKSNPPCLIVGEHENYLLNTPQKYYCGRCAHLSKEEKQAGVVRKYRTKFTWLDTDSNILQQLAMENGDVFEMLPCHLLDSSNRAGIDKNLFKSIVSSAARGISPGSFSDILERNHHELWQLKEKKWGAFVNRRIAQPLLCFPEDEAIVMCPTYFSDKIGGTVPSRSWLVRIFCTIADNEYVEHFLSFNKQGQKNQRQKQAISAAKCEIFFQHWSTLPKGWALPM